MPDGELRRPPQLWEQKLARKTATLGVGVSSGDGTSIVTPTPTPGTGPGIEPSPSLPPPGVFGKPSTPTLTGAVQGIRVAWNGLTAAGEIWPYNSAWIEVHMSTSGTGFTPSSSTLKGRLDYAGEFYVGGLTAGTTYYFRLRGADAAGNFTEPSDTASGQTGLTTSSDYGTATISAGAVSFNARQIGGVTTTVGTTQPTSPVVGDVWLDTTGGSTTHKRWNGSTWQTILFGSGSIADNAITTVKIDQAAITEAKLSSNAVTAGKIAAGAISADKIAANAITADKIAANAITSDKIAANTITASDIAANTITGSLIAANTITSTNIGAGAITAGAIAAGAVTAGKIAADAIDAMTITGATVRSNSNVYSWGAVGAGVILDTAGIRGYNGLAQETFNLNASTGDALLTGNFRTGVSGARIEMGNIFGVLSGQNFYTVSGYAGFIGSSVNGGLLLQGAGATGVEVNSNLLCYGQNQSQSLFIQDGSYFQGANVDMFGVYFNNTTGIDQLGITSGYRVRRISSTQAIKYDIATLSGEMSPSVDAGRLTQVVTVNPHDVLDLAVAEFSVIDDGEPTERRVLGFIADDVHDKFPIAATTDEDGTPAGVLDTAIVASLLAVVKEQQQTIADLTARVTALESA